MIHCVEVNASFLTRCICREGIAFGYSIHQEQSYYTFRVFQLLCLRVDQKTIGSTRSLKAPNSILHGSRWALEEGPEPNAAGDDCVFPNADLLKGFMGLLVIWTKPSSTDILTSGLTAASESASSSTSSSRLRLRVVEEVGNEELEYTSKRVSLAEENIASPVEWAREGPCVRVNRLVLYPSLTLRRAADQSGAAVFDAYRLSVNTRLLCESIFDKVQGYGSLARAVPSPDQ
ncbi:hypothetical protein CPB85DRAFT_1297285 [Mucidula mucida]|nr:hypothetical protein CPB85DRAFT_1297285 [Mucidula mucida]